ncbi:6-phosphogluconolactonase [Rhodococcus sp. D2-41]|uniref:6-phosphogluconolactonase n=1 Tax=Speluncibacter jeojiensis TaxID=2710754 RepID=A0A9X4RIA0_9ACTN|nr:6-phosphogluconolactonase [Rhodococcus sp. D2-41]MDG3011227.1 6-phosphogluconolactonase [Rhodococcus sp. D2-41]MDG3015921.1 6-phosphogluconolactonase [Corynebacteriales bacterium D3-21]
MTAAAERLIFPDQSALVNAAAARFVGVVVAAQRERGIATVVLTGGGAGIALLAAVRDNPGEIDWSNIEIYWGDERFVEADDPERNELQARHALLDHVPVDEARVHPMAATDGRFGDDADAAARDYATVLAAGGHPVPEFDVHLLGMGGEGHVNSLFPHTPAVREQQASVVAVRDCPKPPPTRITLTLPAVRRARQVWLLVAGEAKAGAVTEALGGASEVDVPSAGATGSEATLWFLDRAAASRLD